MFALDSSLARIVYVLFLIALGWLSFGGLWSHQFDTDDHEWLQETPIAIDNFEFYFSPTKHTPIRPPVDALFALGYLIWGDHAGAFHMLQIFLHFIITLQVVFLFHRFGIRLEICFLAGLLFFINVTHFRALHWIFILNHLLATFFVLIFLELYRQYLECERSALFYSALVFLGIAIFAHPSVISVAVFALYLTYQKKANIRKTIASSWGVILAIPLLILLSYGVSPQSPQGRGILTTYPDVQSIFFYFFWFLGRLFTNAHWLIGGVLEDPPMWELLVGFLCLLATLWFYLKARFPVGHWFVWCVITVLPFIHRAPDFQFLPFGPSRQLYVATIGSSMILALGIFYICEYIRARWHKTIGLILGGAVVLLMCFSSVFALRQLEAPSLYTSGRSYIARGNLELGRDLILRAIVHESNLVPSDAYLRLATASFVDGIAHTNIFKGALEQYPQNPRLMMLMGFSLCLSSEPDVVLRGWDMVKEAFTVTSDNETLAFEAGLVLQNMAGHFHKKDDYENAIALYKKALFYRPHYSVALFNLANVLHKKGNVSETIATLYRLLNEDAKNLKALQFLGNVLFEEKQYDQAKEVYMQYVEISDRDPNVYYNLALAHQKLKEFDLAVAAFKKGLELAPYDVDLRMKLASCLYEMGKIEDVVQEYEWIVEQNPTNGDVLQQLVSLLLELQHVQQAEMWVQKALNLDSRQAAFWFLLAHVRQAQDDLIGLHLALKNAVQRAPSEASYYQAYLNLGSTLQQQGKIDLARDIYQDLTAIVPGLAGGHYNLGILNFSQQRYDEAIKNFSMTVSLWPQDIEALLGLAQAYEKQSKLKDARETYERVLKLDAQNTIAIEQLGALGVKG